MSMRATWQSMNYAHTSTLPGSFLFSPPRKSARNDDYNLQLGSHSNGMIIRYEPRESDGDSRKCNDSDDDPTYVIVDRYRLEYVIEAEWKGIPKKFPKRVRLNVDSS